MTKIPEPRSAPSPAATLFDRAMEIAVELAKADPLKDTGNEAHERDLALLIYALASCHQNGMTLPKTLGWVGRIWEHLDTSMIQAIFKRVADAVQEQILRDMPVDNTKTC